MNPLKPTRRVEQSEHGYTVFIKPPITVGDLPEVSVFLSPNQFERYQQWLQGAGSIQALFPGDELSASEREMLLSGLGDDDCDRFAKP